MYFLLETAIFSPAISDCRRVLQSVCHDDVSLLVITKTSCWDHGNINHKSTYINNLLKAISLHRHGPRECSFFLSFFGVYFYKTKTSRSPGSDFPKHTGVFQMDIWKLGKLLFRILYPFFNSYGRTYAVLKEIVCCSCQASHWQAGCVAQEVGAVQSLATKIQQ